MNNVDDPASIHRGVMMDNLDEIAQAVSGGENVDAIDPEGRTALFMRLLVEMRP